MLGREKSLLEAVRAATLSTKAGVLGAWGALLGVPRRSPALLGTPGRSGVLSCALERPVGSSRSIVVLTFHFLIRAPSIFQASLLRSFRFSLTFPFFLFTEKIKSPPL